MENKKQSWIRIAEVLLGVLLGAVLTLTVVRYRESRRILNAKYVEWRKLNLILDEIEKNYVDTIDQAGMTDAAIAGALAQLDPHSVYLPPVKRQQADEELAGNFEGIGIQFNVPNDTAIVLEVIAGGPAEKAGMLPGDRLLKVDDKVIAGVKFPQDSMVRRMKGPSGTKVLVTVGRGADVIPFEIVRGKIPLHSIDAAFMVDDTTGYVRLAKFSSATRKDFVEAYTNLLEQGMKHLMMDLRDNSGGFLDQALLLSNEFLSRGDTIVYMEGLHRPREVFRADGHGKLKDIGLTVLISENSASSSEIFAGAIQDNDRGTIVGRRSFGKGLVQEQFAFTDESGLRLRRIRRWRHHAGRLRARRHDPRIGLLHRLQPENHPDAVRRRDVRQVREADPAHRQLCGYGRLPETDRHPRRVPPLRAEPRRHHGFRCRVRGDAPVPAAATERPRRPVLEAERERVLQVLSARGHHRGGGPQGHPERRMMITLTGFMGSGKTTVGKVLADFLG